MGNSSSSSGRAHHDESVDYGFLYPQGIYTGSPDWDQSIVSHLIVARKLAPFYRPLEDYDDSWDDEQILAAKKELLDHSDNSDSVAHAGQSSKYKRPVVLKESTKAEAQIYRGAVECPICFLYYPPNINHSRCCDQAICTECFVQIKRNEPTATHLVSEPAACPYCVQENFGVVYTPPPWRAGLGSEDSNVAWSDPQRGLISTDSPPPPTHKRRQKSFSADNPEVTTIDKIRPDWEAKLESVRATVARRANRRIIMRQVGDRLIPVGVTSGRVQVLTPEEAAAVAASDGGSRRNRRRHNQQNGGFEPYLGMGGQDIEELMLMEAMRLSLLDHEEHQRKEAEEKKKEEALAAATATAASVIQSDGDGPGPSTLEGRQSLLDTSSSSNLSSTSSISRSASPSFPTHTKVGSQDSLTPGKRSWSFSRSRTPPSPAPVDAPLTQDSFVTWRNRSAGPAASSSSSAALLAATPASNGRDRRVSRSITPEPGNRNPVSLQSSTARRVSLDNPMPIITLNNDRTSAFTSRGENNSAVSSAPFSNDPMNQQPVSASQPMPSTSASTLNGLDAGTLSHGLLSLSLRPLPPLDFEANDDPSKVHPY